MRRWLFRLLFTCCVSLPLFYLFALPWLMQKLNDKARADSYMQCQNELQANGMVGAATSLLKAPEADVYCHCVSDNLTLTRADLPDLVQHRMPASLTATMKTTVDTCNAQLKADINAIIHHAPAPQVSRDAEGVETIYFK